MADWKLRGPLFEMPDREWEEHNPPDFSYGRGGNFMRAKGAGDPQSAPSQHFLNAYSTSSIAEDKAEVWGRAMKEAWHRGRRGPVDDDARLREGPAGV